MIVKESRNLEFKEQVTKTFLKTVSAYANYGAGEIRFGIKDDGQNYLLRSNNRRYCFFVNLTFTFSSLTLISASRLL